MTSDVVVFGIRRDCNLRGGGAYNARLMVSITTLVVPRVYHYRHSWLLSVVSIELASAEPNQ